ncbi:MAG: cytochrome-c peroxidase, partial [Prosthecobacter sp.]
MIRPFAILLLTVLCRGAEGLLPDQRVGALPMVAKQTGDTPEKIELGRLLFFDPILSGTQKVACASCHHPQYGWADGRVTFLGLHGDGLGSKRQRESAALFPSSHRNTPTVLNAAFNGIEFGKPHSAAKAPMFWDSRIEGLEAQVLAPIRSREEMLGEVLTEVEAIPEMLKRLRAVPEYLRLFDGEISEGEVVRAIAAYERTLITPETPFDRFMRG